MDEKTSTHLMFVKRFPFHVSIVMMIAEAWDSSKLDTLGRVIVSTIIPKDHELVIAAWRQRLEELDLDPESWHPEVLESLNEQKRQSERKTTT